MEQSGGVGGDGYKLVRDGWDGTERLLEWVEMDTNWGGDGRDGTECMHEWVGMDTFQYYV